MKKERFRAHHREMSMIKQKHVNLPKFCFHFSRLFSKRDFELCSELLRVTGIA